MGILKKFASLFSPASKEPENAYRVVVRCNRCGEELRTRVNLHNDLSVEYGEAERDTRYFCRKVLIGSAGCFQRVEVELIFDSGRRLVDRWISGGQFIDDSAR